MKNKKTFRILSLTLAMTALAVGFAFADASPFLAVATPVITLLNSLLTPLMLIVGAAGSLYCILLGVKYAKAEEPQDREKAKQHLKSAIIGFILIFVLIVVLNLLMTPMMQWVQTSTNNNVNFGVTNTTTTTSGTTTTTTGNTTSTIPQGNAGTSESTAPTVVE